MYNETSWDEAELILANARQAFRELKKYSIRQRASFMRTIAVEIEALGDELIKTAMAETNLTEPRLIGERARTILQWNSYANYAELGNWMDVRIDTASRTLSKTDIRKTAVALGPVAVFGAGNFPFAFSTAGGDTASAIAAGCPVVVKAHPGHPKTCVLMAQAIEKARVKCRMPEGVFAQVYSTGIEIGQLLVKHEVIKAVAFTGSFKGGKAIADLAAQRHEPIPVFAEMGSINPVFLLPEKLRMEAAQVADQFIASVTLGVGQFCTNPGLMVGIAGDDLNTFTAALKNAAVNAAPATMLHPGIAQNFEHTRSNALQQSEVTVLAQSGIAKAENQGDATIASVSAATFIANPALHQEVFGPYSLLVVCQNADEMLAVAEAIEGQLTATFIATSNDLAENQTLTQIVQERCGRIIVNQFPTGVEVCLAMHHGGPYPATTNSAHTSVGADGIKRFTRPLSFQNWPNEHLPEELQNANPLEVWRTINNELTLEPIGQPVAGY
ncbi:aldehyde dehydrogenase (NADP(+)) [Mucilaginibacter terrae]|uniref:Alpha-ketoglutaric semialdehyde dehydrogenase n=1 Tax=Mucilaginibacter terrae TaxID=1955052 RepID=A0ABU3GVK4_9SPHI|nr:aldehyde dehydrogenase (NADP(+)) [Mucilaginibacter terrae]MDT3403690.1 alpha-ketoglutaric semialdehyde dehydrogenase [Mucilaginibacter terrae]